MIHILLLLGVVTNFTDCEERRNFLCREFDESISYQNNSLYDYEIYFIEQFKNVSFTMSQNNGFKCPKKDTQLSFNCTNDTKQDTNGDSSYEIRPENFSESLFYFLVAMYILDGLFHCGIFNEYYPR